jgi:hypothetical protein
VLSIATGHDVEYLTKAVGGGREGYYTAAPDTAEPPGLWYGAGARELGLAGEVDAELMEAIYSRLLDPRDPATHQRGRWGEAEALAQGHRAYRNAEQIYAQLLDALARSWHWRRTVRRRIWAQAPVTGLMMRFGAFVACHTGTRSPILRRCGPCYLRSSSAVPLS